MEAKHTLEKLKVAGADRYGDRQEQDRLIYTEIDGEKYHVAETFQYHNHKHNQPDGSSIAYADLFAAAPELLEALKRLLNEFKKWEGYHDWTEEDEVAADQAEAAITKATPSPSVD